MTPFPKRRFILLTLLGLLAFVFAGGGAKTNPGGPFISVLCDILPVVVAIYTLAATVRLLADNRVLVRLLAFIPMPPAIFAIDFVANNMLSFWSNPYARGPTISL